MQQSFVFLRQKCSSLCLSYLQQTAAAAATTDRSGSSSGQQETDLSAQAQRGVGDGGRASLKAWRSGVNAWCSDHVNSVEQPAARELSSSNSGQETSSSAASPLPQHDVEMEMEGPKTDPAKWSVSGSFQKGRECGWAYERERESRCERERERECVCVCVCEREREKERECGCG